jgi:intracellular sulfur oxidation DsrE/DsrF family protein
MNEETASKRRSFLTRFNAGAAALAGLAMGSVAKAAEAARWQPARHEKDDWLDQLPGQHRMVFDTIFADGLGRSIRFADNYMAVNRSDYGLQNSDLAVVIVVRYRSVSFAYNDAIWAKYGAAISAQSGFVDPKTKAAPKINVFNSGDYGNLTPNLGTTLDTLFKEGVQLAVCSVATRNVAGAIAGATGGNANTIYNELTANLLSNARMVPAGIVAVNRAQERGYSLVTG